MLKEPYKSRVDSWIVALRSGKYAQGWTRLRFNNKYCCLGVACDLFNPELWTDNEVYLSNISRLAPDVQEYYGLKTSSGLCNSGSKLTTMNDHGYSFISIADFIEKCTNDPESGLFIPEAYDAKA